MLELIGEAVREEVAEEPRSAFDEETQCASFGQIFQDEIEGERVAGV